MDVSNAAYALPDRELVLDRYRPLRPIGRGGSGSVWLARDERSGLEIALKIVPREGKRAARAMREMEAASRLRHERCVRAYDFGGDEGHVYIAYEYVAGQTLRELMRAGRLNDRDAVEAAAQVLDALAHAHTRGIVHRDVKPSNIIVEDAPTLGVRLLDFGLAQFDEADTLTAVGDVPGTLAYIAPERLAGKDASERSDIWAVGVLLWEALSGRHPFWGVPMQQVASTIAAGAAPLATQRPDLSRRLQALVDSALSVEPSRRPSARELAADLRDAIANPRDRSDGARPARQRAPQREQRSPRPAPARPSTAGAERKARHPGVVRAERIRRAAAAGAAAAATVVGGTLLPFWPSTLLGALAILAAATAVWLPRASLAVVLLTPVFPLGNVAEGAALAYAAVALAWLAATWTEPRKALLFLAAPVLGAVGLLAMLPLAVAPARHPLRRALHVVGGILAAALVAGLSGTPLPFAGEATGDLRVAREESPFAVAQAAWNALTASQGTVAAMIVLALVAACLPFARRKGAAEVGVLMTFQAVGLVLLAPHAPHGAAVGGTLALTAVLLAPAARAVLRRRQAAQAAE